jgi:hypothetical protein
VRVLCYGVFTTKENRKMVTARQTECCLVTANEPLQPGEENVTQLHVQINVPKIPLCVFNKSAHVRSHVWKKRKSVCATWDFIKRTYKGPC